MLGLKLNHVSKRGHWQTNRGHLIHYNITMNTVCRSLVLMIRPIWGKIPFDSFYTYMWTQCCSCTVDPGMTLGMKANVWYVLNISFNLTKSSLAITGKTSYEFCTKVSGIFFERETFSLTGWNIWLCHRWLNVAMEHSIMISIRA